MWKEDQLVQLNGNFGLGSGRHLHDAYCIVLKRLKELIYLYLVDYHKMKGTYSLGMF